MPYVQRDAGNNIVGVYAALQPGIAEEFLPDNDPAVVAYHNPPPTVIQLAMAAYKADPTRQALLTLIQGATPAQINTWLANNCTTLPQARAILAQLIFVIGGMSVS